MVLKRLYKGESAEPGRRESRMRNEKAPPTPHQIVSHWGKEAHALGGKRGHPAREVGGESIWFNAQRSFVMQRRKQSKSRWRRGQEEKLGHEICFASD